MGRSLFGANGNKCIMAATVTLLVFFGIKYISPIVAPFVVAFLLAGLMNPLVLKINRKCKIKKSIVAGMILFFFCALAGLLLWLLFSALCTGGGYIAKHMPGYQENLCYLLGNCCSNLEKQFGIDGLAVEKFILEQSNVLIHNLEIKVFPAIMGKSMGYMKNIAGFFSFLVVMLIAILLIMKDYDRMISDFREREELKGVWEVAIKVVIYVKTFIRAQCIILITICILCAVTLWLIGIEGGFFYGLLTGVMDMLPFVGTGIMLVPLAFFQLLKGKYWQSVICFILYGVCALVREFMEPKLIGNKVGVWPIGILFAVFAGIYLFGITGIVKGPLALVIICETCKYLWHQ